MKRLLTSTSIFLALCAVARADSLPGVYPGCESPPAQGVGATLSGSTWTVAPTQVDATADGSPAKPWSLASIFVQGVWGSPRLSTVPYHHYDAISKAWVTAPNSSAAVKPGDTIQLLPGSYGPLQIGVYGQIINNSKWVTFVSADPAQPAVLSQIRVGLSTRMRFTKLNLRPDGKTTGPFVLISGAGANVIVDHVDAAMMEDDTALALATEADWEAQVTRNGFGIDGRQGMTCASITESHFHAVMGGGGATGGGTYLIADNEISYFSRDGIDFGANNSALLRNFIHDTQNTSDSHQDGIQGFGPSMDGSATQYTNGKMHGVLIDSNRIFRQLDPRSKFSKYLQGIDAYDSDWTDVKIIRNVVTSYSCWGISWGSTHYGLIAHNTTVWDGSSASSKCEPVMIPFTNTHEYLGGGDHVVAINNIVSGLGLSGVAQTADATGALTAAPYDPATRGSKATNNLAFGVPMSFFDIPTQKITWVGKPGVYQGNTLLAVDAPTNVFVNLGRSTVGAGPFDLHPQSASPAIGLGLSSLPELDAIKAAYPDLTLPATDIDGVAYDAAKPTAGAYAYQPPKVCTSPTTNCVQPPPPPPVCTTTPGSCSLPPSE